MAGRPGSARLPSALGIARATIEMVKELLALHGLEVRYDRPHNTLEASMCKVTAGDVITRVTQKGVGLLGPPGYSRRLLVEKWMRDAKINDLFEGTGQINRLVIARRILGYTSREVK